MISASSACGSCAFFDDHHGNGAAPAEGGLCRFNPPVSQPGPDAHGLWPVVSEKDWCGHFEADKVGGMTAAE